MAISHPPQKNAMEVFVPLRDLVHPRGVILAGVIIVLTVFAAYHNSFSGPFIFDDIESIPQNPSIRQLNTALLPPAGGGITVSGRPVLNASFALNYAIARNNVGGFHCGNVLIHIFAALTLFAVVRRTLQSAVFNDKFSTHATMLAGFISVLWAVHPLQTESVIYTVQRAESLVGLFYLFTIYGFIRYTVDGSWFWFLLTGLACLLGMGTKEVMATAPFVIFLYDRTFVSGSFRAAWHRHGRLHLCLSGTLVLLVVLVIAGRGRDGTVGVNETATWWGYVCTQPVAILHYLWLTVWPTRLTFDYGTLVEKNYAVIVPCALSVGCALAGTTFAVIRKPPVGFLGVWVFAILAPSSSVIPIVTQTVAEHRIYLPLAALIGLGVLGLYTGIARHSLYIFTAMAVGLGWQTIQRNEDYRTELSIWRDTVAKHTSNARAYSNLADALQKIPDGLSEAIFQYETALRINPNYGQAHVNLGCALARIPGRLPEAIAQYEAAIRINPNNFTAHYNLGNALVGLPGRLPDAITQYEVALRTNPKFFKAHVNLGSALAGTPGRLPDAIFHYLEAVRIKPDDSVAHFCLGNVLAKIPEKWAEAIYHYEEALRINPNYVEAHVNLANALAGIPGRLRDVIFHNEEALRIKPDDSLAHVNLGNALACIPGRLPEAITQYEAALHIKPDDSLAHVNLGNALACIPGRLPEAIAQYESALRIKPDFAEAHYNLGLALMSNPDRLPEAVAEFQATLKINPNHAEAHYNWGVLLTREPVQSKQALVQFEEAVRIKPEWETARKAVQLLQADPNQQIQRPL